MTIEVSFQGEIVGRITSGAEITNTNPARLDAIVEYYQNTTKDAMPEKVLWKILERMKPGRQWQAIGVAE